MSVASEKTINNYFAFRRRPQKNTRLNVASPEPGDCPIDGTPSSIRGWAAQVYEDTLVNTGKAPLAVQPETPHETMPMTLPSGRTVRCSAWRARRTGCPKISATTRG